MIAQTLTLLSRYNHAVLFQIKLAQLIQKVRNVSKITSYKKSCCVGNIFIFKIYLFILNTNRQCIATW